ncbi:MAG: hypothetical protein IJQ40_01830 [Bacilli bacterium]|nr:hypothetical protein [Bacilli bacterium]
MKSRIKILIAAIFSLSLIGGSIFLEPKIDAQPVDAVILFLHITMRLQTLFTH